MVLIIHCLDGVMIAIECKAWARNIEHDSQDRRGLVHFEVEFLGENILNKVYLKLSNFS